MKQVSREAREEYNDIVFDVPTRVQIAGTRRIVRLTGIKPYTLERLTKLWMERDLHTIPDNATETAYSMCREPYFAIKEAVILTLNNFWALHLIYPIKWRVWAYLREYREEQMTAIIQEGKKKLPLSAHWQNMAFSVDMRTDMMKMTTKEAEQYRAELLSAVNAVSSRNSQSTEERDSE